MKKKILTTILLIAGLMLVSSMASAQSGNCDLGKGPKMHGQGGPGSNWSGQKGHGKCGNGQMGHGMKGNGQGHLLKMADQLELTDDQINEIKKLKTDFQLLMVDAKADLQKAKIKMQSLKQDDASESKIFSAIDKCSELQADMKKMKYSHHQEMKSVLTEEQQEKAKELRLKHGQRGMHGNNDGYGRKGGRKFGHNRQGR